MKAAEWIDRVKIAQGWDSDYRVSKELGLSRQTVSKYRSGTSTTMDDDAALKVAAVLGAAPEVVLLDQAIERTKSTEAKAALAGLLKRLGGAAASILLAAGMTIFPNGNNALSGELHASNDIHRGISNHHRGNGPVAQKPAWNKPSA